MDNDPKDARTHPIVFVLSQHDNYSQRSSGTKIRMSEKIESPLTRFRHRQRHVSWFYPGRLGISQERAAYQSISVNST